MAPRVPVTNAKSTVSSDERQAQAQAAQANYYNDQLSRPRYDVQDKERALELVDQGISYRAVAKIIGSTCNCGTVGYWVKQRKAERATEESLKGYREIQIKRDNAQDRHRPDGHRMADLGT